MNLEADPLPLAHTRGRGHEQARICALVRSRMVFKARFLVLNGSRIRGVRRTHVLALTRTREHIRPLVLFPQMTCDTPHIILARAHGDVLTLALTRGMIIRLLLLLPHDVLAQGVPVRILALEVQDRMTGWQPPLCSANRTRGLTADMATGVLPRHLPLAQAQALVSLQTPGDRLQFRILTGPRRDLLLVLARSQDVAQSAQLQL